MISKKDFKKISDYLWEIPKSFGQDMKVPARVYASEKMLGEMFKDKTLEQLLNSTSLPGIEKYALVMPDGHEGYGVPIGFVGAMRLVDGVISPGAIGYDQNCGVRLLKSELNHQEAQPYLEKLATKIQAEVPSGLGRGRVIKLSLKQVDEVLEGGVPKLVEQGYGGKEDIENCEEKGKMELADASCVSEKAKNRGRDQVGTLGSGNHFLELQKVEEIFDQEVAKNFGLFRDQVVVMIHTGSRGLGHQNCTDYLQIAVRAMSKYGIGLPDRELACVPFSSSEGQRFLKAMSAACNFAWSNRHMIMHYVRESWKSILGPNADLKLLYDVAHNIAKIEEHQVDGARARLIVHRKGATRAFTGQPVIIPGSMGTASYILVGQESGKEAWFSSCHGAGRMMSRHEAMRRISGREVIQELKRRGIIVKCWSDRNIAEEAPLAYKDVDSVVDVVHNTGLSKKVAKLIPLAVIKGE